MAPFLNGNPVLPLIFLVAILTWFSHYIGFAHNSVMDATMVSAPGEMPYDFKDPSKKHHPTITGEINLMTAKRVVLWGYGGVVMLFAFTAIIFGANPLYAVTGLLVYYLFGSIYNQGLSKESTLGFISQNLCFTGMAVWAWFLSHTTVSPLGLLFFAYVFCIIAFQGFEGMLKEFNVKETSNLLVRFGATIKGGYFRFHNARIIGVLIKAPALIFGIAMLAINFTIPLAIYATIFSALPVYFAYQLLKDRPYDRTKDLKTMSLHEITAIFFPIPFLVGLNLGTVLLLGIAIASFFIANRYLWGVSHPAV